MVSVIIVDAVNWQHLFMENQNNGDPIFKVEVFGFSEPADRARQFIPITDSNRPK